MIVSLFLYLSFYLSIFLSVSLSLYLFLSVHLFPRIAYNTITFECNCEEMASCLEYVKFVPRVVSCDMLEKKLLSRLTCRVFFFFFLLFYFLRLFLKEKASVFFSLPTSLSTLSCIIYVKLMMCNVNKQNCLFLFWIHLRFSSRSADNSNWN